MKVYTAVIEVATTAPEELVDLTAAVRAEVARSGVENGICALYAHGATAALMVQENDDPAIALDVIDCLARLIPAGRWRHDRVDDNGAAHLKAGIIGPSETLPIRSGELALSTWQNIFLCDFDGPRRARHVLCTITGE